MPRFARHPPNARRHRADSTPESRLRRYSALMSEPSPHIRTFTLGPHQTNCHVVTVPDHPGCWVVDCGMQPRELIDHVTAAAIPVDAILLTHCHCDHIAGLDQLRRAIGEDVPLMAHEAERGWCSEPMLNLSALLGVPVSVGEPTRWLRGGETLRLGPTTWSVLHLPGHSPGGVAFIHIPSGQAISGDTLFADSVGRVDFPTSDPEAMQRSLQLMAETLPQELRIYPGHGPTTTIGKEKRTNPFLRELDIR